ncbi:hypothetical protein CLV41_104191 [Roseibium marinum]|uniref:Carboxypeptidase regulatory-like domain-containing protein n=1 Tax=Roseibium marinum TaxID=281252 RepID=A0A2S3UV75_9HYPH|nr:hypothetical protein CLV41_104191 [Roseibium marinum]
MFFASRIIRSVLLPLMLFASLLSGGGLAAHAQSTQTPLPPAVKPDPNAPSAPPEEPIINLLDREPEPLFSDTLVPYAPARSVTTDVLEGLDQGALYLMAKLTPDSSPLNDGLIWRIYSETTNTDGRLQLVATSQGGDAEFRLDPGTYLVHTAYGFAQATNRIVIGKEVQSKMLTLNAGGIKFGAALKDGEDLDDRIVSFDIYGMDFDERGERDLIASNVKPGSILRLSADTYHVVSRYGDVNAVVRADIQVLPGKLTEATIFHKAADITLKLVNERGGEAIANTTWSVLSPGGDIVVEATGAFPDFVLAEGEYEAIARNNGRTYLHTFEVAPGEDREVEVVTSMAELASQEETVSSN